MNVTTPSQAKGPRKDGVLNKTLTLVAKSGVKIVNDTGGISPLRQVTIQFTNAVYDLTDDGATGHYSGLLFTFPAGAIVLFQAVQDLDLVATAGANIQVSLGSTASADATLSSTDVDMCPASSASTSNGNSLKTAASYHNGTVTPVAGYLNIGTSGDPSAGATVTLNGTITLTFVNGGDF